MVREQGLRGPHQNRSEEMLKTVRGGSSRAAPVRFLEGEEQMKLIFLLLWLAGGGLLAFTVYFCVNLLRVCEARQDAEHEEVWNLLIARDRV